VTDPNASKTPPASAACPLLLKEGNASAKDSGLNQVFATTGGPPQFWQSVVELFGDAVFLVGPDRKILYWNKAAENLTGYTREEVVGSSCLRAVHCEVCEHRCGVFEMGELRDVPLTLRDRLGKRVDVVKNATVIRDPAGNPIVGIEVLRDMTEWNARERVCTVARQSAERQQSLLRGVLDSAQEGILGVGNDLSVRFVSAAAQAALRSVEPDLLDKPIDAIAGSELADLVRHVVQTGAPVSRPRLVFTAADGTLVPLSVSAAPMRLPGEPDGAMLVIRDLYEEERAQRERIRDRGFAFGTLQSRSPRMHELFELIDQAAPTNATLLIQGESGTGKELVAREIHKRSRRAAGPFHAVNCAAISPEILESEFFGHERGAFTGAFALKKGRFEVAHTGTIFLDEVGELPLELQAKLLRVLEERSFERVGGTKPIQVDVRLVAATNRDLATMVQQGRFREDLYYRLRVVPIRLPSLRERMEDVELLVEGLLQRVAEREGRPVLRLSSEALRLMLDYHWPGNVRELANAIEYVSVIAKGPVVQAADLPRELRSQPVPPPSSSRTAALTPAPAPESSQDPLVLVSDERSRLEAALIASKWSHGKAAELLRMHRTTLYRKRQRYGL